MKHCYCGAWGEIWKSGEKEDKESSRSYEAVVLTKKKEICLQTRKIELN